MDKTKVDEVILVGGSTRIPKIREILEGFFTKKQLNISLNPDEAVAIGATIQAAILNKESSDQLKKMVLLDVAPLSLGVEIVGDLVSVIIPRNTTIPAKREEKYTTSYNNQRSVEIVVLEGEGRFVKDCKKLGRFVINGIPPAPACTP